MPRLVFRRPRRWVVSVRGVLPVSSSSSTVVVAVEVGKRSFAVSVTAADRRRLFGPVEVAMTRPAVSELIGRIGAVLPAAGVLVAVEAAGHYRLFVMKRGERLATRCSAWA